jgi:hypothetical protein
VALCMSAAMRSANGHKSMVTTSGQCSIAWSHEHSPRSMLLPVD